MRKIVIFLNVLVLIVGSCGGQATKKQEQIIASDSKDENIDTPVFQKEFDFSPLWLDNRVEYLGYIGDNYQRLHIFIETVGKISETQYQISGSSRVKSNECNFKGTITQQTIREFTEEEFEYGVDECMKGKFLRQGIIVADFLLEEDQNQKGSETFQGTLQTKWYVDLNNELKYDDIRDYADNYANNQFWGTWTSYTIRVRRKVGRSDNSQDNKAVIRSQQSKRSCICSDSSSSWQAVCATDGCAMDNEVGKLNLI
jgi:hypothetical protein